MTTPNKNTPKPHQKRRTGPKQVSIPANPTPEEHQKLIDRAKYTTTWHLQQSDKTAHEITQKLAAKGYPQEYITPVIEWAQDLGYINDEKYANRYTQNRLHQYGATRIKQDLTRKGVPSHIIDAALEEYATEETQEETATRHAAKKVATNRNLTPDGKMEYKEQQKIIAGLQRKGYPYAIARKALATALQEKQDELAQEAWDTEEPQ